MRKHDWADALAREIASDLGAKPDKDRLDLVAARLKIVRQTGVVEGIDQARKAIPAPEKTS